MELELLKGNETMVNIYVLGAKDTPEDEHMLNRTLPNMLEAVYGITDKKRIITGDLINHAGFIADRLAKEDDAMLVLLTEKDILTVKPECKEKAIELLLKYPNESAYDVLVKDADTE